MRNTTAIAAALSLGIGVAAGVADANSILLKYDGYGAHLQVGVAYSSNAAWNAGASSSFSNIQVGEHKFNAFGKNYRTFCVQVFEGLTVGETVLYNIVGVPQVPDAPPAPGPMGTIKAILVNDLYWRFYQYVIDGSQTPGERDIRASAFQLALYEITHENLAAGDAATAAAQLDLGLGAFQSKQVNADPGIASAISLAADFLDDLGDRNFHTYGAGLMGLTNPLRQDQLIVVPLPAIAGMATLGLAMAGVLRRRLMKK